jgi:lysophospholipase L1-like esterase
LSRAPLGGRLALAAGSLLLALGAVELGVRVWRPQSLGMPEGTTPVLRGQFREPGVHPNVSEEFSVRVHVNQHRFVDREWPAWLTNMDSEARKPLVIVVGDSFVEAAQVELEQGFGRVLEERLEAELEAQVELLSMGVPGAGTAHEYELLTHHALPLGPDLVVLGLLVSNDIFNNHPLLDNKTDKIFLVPTPEGLLPTNATVELDAGWRVPVLWQISHAWRLWARTVKSRQLGRDRLARGEGMPIDLRVHDPEGGPLWDEAWTITDAVLAEMAKRCAEQGARFAVLIVPSQVEATEAGRAAAVEAWPAMAGWDLDRTIGRAEAMAATHAPVLDLTTALRAADGEPPLYYEQDGHWTPRGHRVAAEAAAPFLAELLGP